MGCYDNYISNPTDSYIMHFNYTDSASKARPAEPDKETSKLVEIKPTLVQTFSNNSCCLEEHEYLCQPELQESAESRFNKRLTRKQYHKEKQKSVLLELQLGAIGH